jgi:hypothetical protein
MKKVLRDTLFTAGMLCGLMTAIVLGAKNTTFHELDVDATPTVQTHHRIYVYLEQHWGVGDMYIHYWGGEVGTTWATCPIMTEVVTDYAAGLFYYDVPIDVPYFLVKTATGDVSKTSDQSDDIEIASLFVSGNYKAAKVLSWVDNGAKRVINIDDTLPGNSGQVAAVLNHIDSCSTSYAGGFNAWPQLNDIFIAPSSFTLSTVVTDNFGPDTTIGDKCDYLEARYTIDQAS